MEEIKYSVADSQNRESLSVKVFISNRSSDFFEDLGLGPYWWIILQFDKENYGANQGDVDVLIGKIELDDANAICWPPKCEYLVACEAKCAYSETDSEPLKATKSSIKKQKSIEQQLRFLIEDGFNKIVLLDLIVHRPKIFDNPWFSALCSTDSSMDKAEHYLGKRPTHNEIIGHYCSSQAPIAGKREFDSGALTSQWIKCPIQNSKSLKPEISVALTALFSKLECPNTPFPIFENIKGDNLTPIYL